MLEDARQFLVAVPLMGETVICFSALILKKAVNNLFCMVGDMRARHMLHGRNTNAEHDDYRHHKNASASVYLAFLRIAM